MSLIVLLRKIFCFIYYFVSDDGPYTIVLIHFGTATYLPEVSIRKNTPQEKAPKFEIIDMAYNEESKIFDCEMNKQALSKIVRLER